MSLFYIQSKLLRDDLFMEFKKEKNKFYKIFIFIDREFYKKYLPDLWSRL